MSDDLDDEPDLVLLARDAAMLRTGDDTFPFALRFIGPNDATGETVDVAAMLGERDMLALTANLSCMLIASDCGPAFLDALAELLPANTVADARAAFHGNGT